MKKEKKSGEQRIRSTFPAPLQDWINYVERMLYEDKDYFEKDPAEWLQLEMNDMEKFLSSDDYWFKKRSSFNLAVIIGPALTIAKSDRAKDFDFDLIIEWMLNHPQYDQMEDINAVEIYFDIIISYFLQQEEFEICEEINKLKIAFKEFEPGNKN